MGALASCRHSPVGPPIWHWVLVGNGPGSSVFSGHRRAACATHHTVQASSLLQYTSAAWSLSLAFHSTIWISYPATAGLCQFADCLAALKLQAVVPSLSADLYCSFAVSEYRRNTISLCPVFGVDFSGTLDNSRNWCLGLSRCKVIISIWEASA